LASAISEEEIPSPSAARPFSRFAAGAIVLLSSILNLHLALRFPLSPDETYYWEWSRHLGWSYFDQGPMIAWWIRASCLMFGDTQLGVRAGIIFAFALTQIILYVLFRDLFGERIAILGLFLLSITPLALVGGFVATYDPLLVLSWSSAMFFASRAIAFQSRPAWLGVGVAFGLGMLSKHTMALFIPCVALAICFHPNGRASFRGPWPYVGLFAATLIFLPSLWWQSNHDWMTYRHLLTLSSKGTDQGFPRRVADFVGSQAGVLTPLLFIGYAGALVSAARRVRNQESPAALLFWMSVPVLVFFTILTAKSKVQANWAVCGWLTPPALYASWYCTAQTNAAMYKRYFQLAIVACVLLSMMLCLPEVRTSLGLRVPVSWESQVNKTYGGLELARAVQAEVGSMKGATGRAPVIGAATYDATARLAFYLPGQPHTYCFFLNTRENSYVLWNSDAGLRRAADAVIVDDYSAEDFHRPRFEDIFDRVEPVAEPVYVFRRPIFKEPVHTYYVYRCYGYHPNAKAETMTGG
jgi:4-amino-4-deoxy-L-arabinose transferase-like glycosyltransferase